MVDLTALAVERAERWESKLPPDAFNFDDSYSGRKGRHLLNNLAGTFLPYIEVGCYLGSTLIAAAYDNPGLVVGVDNFTDETKPGRYMVENRRRLLERLSHFSDRARPSLIDAPCWDLKLTGFLCGFYDGDHSAQAHIDALVKLAPWFSQSFVYVIDDYNRQNVRDGTAAGISAARLKVDFEMRLGEHAPPDDRLGWWNGIGVFVFTKSI